MARVDGAVQVRVGLYAALLELEERRVARYPDFTAEDGAVFRYPRFRLERLRAGLPVQAERWFDESAHEVHRRIPRRECLFARARRGRCHERY